MCTFQYSKLQLRKTVMTAGFFLVVSELVFVNIVCDPKGGITHGFY